ncbi:MAG: DNA gyrase subunit A [Bacteroidetes bacterium]|nr:DNA gyrase subunit A [Bacteroidota bacterium]
MEIQEGEKIIKVNIENQMKSSYIDYSMSVIVSRALPDVRDGLKPVHRRILFAMYDLGILSNRPYKKSARIVGEVLGKYHPHGDTSVYDAMVRMAQDWSLRYPMIDGQGNFGSIDQDPPAAMRYTEARLQKIAEECLSDLDKDTVDFQLNFDDSLKEPCVLPSRIPQLLINGTSGIAVGMATNMPPHNLTEVIDGTIAYIDNREITIPELMKFIKAPDFPTGGIIYGYEGVRDAFETGRGRIVIRGESTIENEDGGKERIIVTSIPYQVNKAEMIKKTADLVNEKKIEGISDIRDESDRTGMRIVYEIKKDAVTNVVLNKLYQYTALQSSFSVNNIALVKGRPMMLNLKDIIRHFVDHRHEVVIRRTKYDLLEAQKRAHILEGLLIALDHIDEVIALIRASATVDDARTGLMEKFGLSELQARAIVDMRLRSLVGLERDKLKEEYTELMKMIEYYQLLLSDEGMRMDVIKKELIEIKDKYGDKAKTEIEYAASDFKIEDTIADEDVVITISHLGYIKRTPLSEYRRQNRGGRGSKGSDSRDEDFLEHLFVASMHNYMLFFTEKGKCFWMRVFEIPEGSKVSKGRAIQNLINIEREDKVRAYINIKNLKDEEYINNNFIILCTKNGIIKKTSVDAYSRPRQNGINAITIREGDQLLEAKLTNGSNEVMLALKSGKAIRFNEAKVRPMGRNAAGVKGITLGKNKDEVIGMICVTSPEDDILVVSENGYGKRSKLEDYRETNRGGKGVKTINITDKTGSLIAIKSVLDNDDLMIINKSGLIIRLAIGELRVMGRATQGVRLIKLRDDDAIAAVTKVVNEDEDEEIIDGEEIIENGDGETTEIEDANTRKVKIHSEHDIIGDDVDVTDNINEIKPTDEEDTE